MKTTALTAALLLAACSATPPPPPETEKVALAYVAKVDTSDKDGSAVAVRVVGGHTLWVTCHHVITSHDGKETLPAAFVTYKGKTFAGKVVADDAKNDLAVLDVEGVFPVAPAYSTALSAGDPEIIVGYPLGIGPLITQGFTSGSTMTFQNHTVDIGSAGASPGNSGGPMFVYKDGRWLLAGIMEAVSVTDDGSSSTISLSVPMKLVTEFLNAKA